MDDRTTHTRLLFELNEISELRGKISQIVNCAGVEELRVIYDWLSSNFGTENKLLNKYH